MQAYTIKYGRGRGGGGGGGCVCKIEGRLQNTRFILFNSYLEARERIIQINNTELHDLLNK